MRESFNKSFEKINENIKWLDQHSEEISQWVEENLEMEEEEEEEKSEQSPTTKIQMTPSPARTYTIVSKPNNGMSNIKRSF